MASLDQHPSVMALRSRTRSPAAGPVTAEELRCRMNREPIRSPARSVANLEFHRTGDHVNDVAGEIVRRLEDRGIRAMNAPVGFPMETSDFPGKIWVVSHKPVAVAAGLGQTVASTPVPV